MLSVSDMAHTTPRPFTSGPGSNAARLCYRASATSYLLRYLTLFPAATAGKEGERTVTRALTRYTLFGTT